jgi:RNA polymerase sigma-70 factor (ECF subfamily)
MQGPGTFNTFGGWRVMAVEMEESDAELVEGVRRGDRRAADRLLERYMRACRAVALAVTRSEADADDICQDGFVIAIERIDSCRDPARFGGWLLQIVRNRARNLLRDGGLRATIPVDDSVPSPASGPAVEAERGELRGRLRAALGTLTQQQREVVLLHDLEGWTHREIAERLELPAGTVRSSLHHARRRLREVLGEDAAR